VQWSNRGDKVVWSVRERWHRGAVF